MLFLLPVAEAGSPQGGPLPRPAHQAIVQRHDPGGTHAPGRSTFTPQALPYAEIGVGAFLVLGLSTTIAALAAGLLLISLEFGLLILANNPESGGGKNSHAHDLPSHGHGDSLALAGDKQLPLRRWTFCLAGSGSRRPTSYHVEPENPAFRTSR